MRWNAATCIYPGVFDVVLILTDLCSWIMWGYPGLEFIV